MLHDHPLVITKTVLGNETFFKYLITVYLSENGQLVFFLEKLFGVYRENFAPIFSYSNNWNTKGDAKGICGYITLAQFVDA